MFDQKASTKVKNNKILRWRLELSKYQCDIQYRPGKENLSADTMSRVCSSVMKLPSLERIHADLCHPGITRLHHFVKMKNLPFSVQDVKRVCAQCHICAQLKPRFFRPPPSHLIHALRPFDRLSVDFIGPKPSTSHNKYLLVMIDEFSRFPFAFPCPDMSAQTVIRKFQSVFSTFGCPSSVHSDRGAQFMSKEVTNFFQTMELS